MRREIIQTLGYPRYMMQSQRDLSECPRCGVYVQNDPKCRNCPDGFECQWLYSHDEFIALERKSDRSLVEALEFAIQYVAGFLLELRHSRASCGCESCKWMRQAERLFNESRAAAGVPDDDPGHIAPGAATRR